MRNPVLFYAAVFGFLAVALGAFAAHGLKNYLLDHDLEIFKTATNYQMYHALALGLVSLMPEQRLLIWVARLFIAGILLFSGSLYLLAIVKISLLGIITPFGGLAFLSGWGVLAYYAWQKNME